MISKESIVAFFAMGAIVFLVNKTPSMATVDTDSIFFDEVFYTFLEKESSKPKDQRLSPSDNLDFLLDLQRDDEYRENLVKNLNHMGYYLDQKITTEFKKEYETEDFSALKTFFKIFLIAFGISLTTLISSENRGKLSTRVHKSVYNFFTVYKMLLFLILMRSMFNYHDQTTVKYFLFKSTPQITHTLEILNPLNNSVLASCARPPLKETNPLCVN